MNKEEQQAFDKYMKAIKRLLIEEKQCKQKLERIQKDKMDYISVLLEGGIYNERNIWYYNRKIRKR